MVVSDNGANMIKAIKILAENAEALSLKKPLSLKMITRKLFWMMVKQRMLAESGEDGETRDDAVFEPESVHYRRMVCMTDSHAKHDTGSPIHVSAS